MKKNAATEHFVCEVFGFVATLIVSQGEFLVKDDRSLRSFARTAHSLRSASQGVNDDKDGQTDGRS